MGTRNRLFLLIFFFLNTQYKFSFCVIFDMPFQRRSPHVACSFVLGAPSGSMVPVCIRFRCSS